MASRATRAAHAPMSTHEVTVSATRWLTPHLRRVTLAAESLREFCDDGPDQRFKLLLPPPGGREVAVPGGLEAADGIGWYAAWLALAAEDRPVLRTYTIRAARPALGEVDVDVVVHDENISGPGSNWARSVRVGDRVAISGAYGEYETDHVEPQLIAGDHSALPAVAAIAERLPDHAQGDVVVAVPGPAERIGLAVPTGVCLHWVDGGSEELVTVVDDLVSRAGRLRSAGSAGYGYAWVCGERTAAQAMRRILVGAGGLTRERVMFMGYWRRDGSIEDA